MLLPFIIGVEDAFVLLKKVNQKECVIEAKHKQLFDKELVQFQVSSINVIGEGVPCFPFCIRLVKPRVFEN